MTNDLISRCKSSSKADNKLDVLIEIALFRPDENYTSVRSNAAGTKLIYTRHGDTEETWRAFDWTMPFYLQGTIAALESIEKKS